MRPDVADTARRAAARRVGSPLGLLQTRLLETRREPPLRVLDDDLAQPTQIALAHEVARQLHHRIAGVVVGQREHPSRPCDDLLEPSRFRHIQRHRLVTDHVETGLQKGRRHRTVQVVLCQDGDEVDPLVLGQRPFPLDHVEIRVIGPSATQPELASLASRLRRARRECPGHELDVAVETGRPSVYVTDERAGAPADHAHAECRHAVASVICRRQRRRRRATVRSRSPGRTRTIRGRRARGPSRSLPTRPTAGPHSRPDSAPG